MPREQEPLKECAARNTSKNAKDKSNSATLRASQSGTHREQSGVSDITNCMQRCDSEKDSEKDSGYSETGSDSVHTDVDDQRSSVSEPQRESSKNSNNNVNTSGPDITSYEELPPVYLVVKPSRPGQLLHGPLAWGGGWHSLTSGEAPTQLLLIQQPTISASSSSAPIPSSVPSRQGRLKEGGHINSQNYNSKNSYLPILNSYPRIAPHPRKDIHEGKGARVEGVKEVGNEGQSQSKRVCIEEEKMEAVSTTTHLLKPQRQKVDRVHSQHKVRGGHSSFPSFSRCPVPSYASSKAQHRSHHFQKNSSSESLGSPSISSSYIPSPPSYFDSPSSSSPSSSSPCSSTAHSPYRLAPDSSSMRQRRFLNTAEILNQSGLLAITLRTKELLKQNTATEREIAQLRQHTRLLSHVAQASQNSGTDVSDSLDKLFQAMSESGSYPSLEFHQLKVLSSTHQQSKTRSEEDKRDNKIETNKMHSSPPQVMSVHNVHAGESPPSPLFAPSPDTKEAEHADVSLDPMSLSVSFPEQEHSQS